MFSEFCFPSNNKFELVCMMLSEELGPDATDGRTNQEKSQVHLGWHSAAQ